MTLKNTYVVVMRSAANVARAIGLLGVLDKSKNRTLIWIRSLFSIYDIKDLIHLDVPWWTFPAIDSVNAYIQGRGGQVRAFEYGSGASTVWLARRCKEVVTVEHDLEFARFVTPLFADYPNISLIECAPEQPSRQSYARSRRKGYEQYSFDSYVEAIDRFTDAFDIIVIDGRARATCLKKAKEHLSDKGIIVFDNSNRQEYREAIAQSGLIEDITRGLAPALPYPSQTSILSKKL